MRIRPEIPSDSNIIEIEKGERAYIQLGGQNAIKVVIGEDEGSITLDLLDEAFLTDGGPDEVRDAGKIRRFAKMTFKLEPKK